MTFLVINLMIPDNEVTTMAMTVTHLFCYPLKGARGFSIDVMSFGRLGPLYDHRWMVVDERGMFVAQRSSRGLGVSIPEMCLIETALVDGCLIFRAPGMPELAVPRGRGLFDPEVQVQVWERKAIATIPSSRANQWFTDFLSRYRPGKYRLVRNSKRDNDLSFADSHSLLVISQASLDELNRRIRLRQHADGERITLPLGWDRFRPTMVIDGCGAHDEDDMSRLFAGAVMLEGRTLCVRCLVTTTNQLTGERGQEPLKTLATYRRNPDGNGVVFGRNFTHLDEGVVGVGDSASIYL